MLTTNGGRSILIAFFYQGIKKGPSRFNVWEMDGIMPSTRTASELYCDNIAFQEFYGHNFDPFDLDGMQRQIDKVIQEMVSKLIAANTNNFNRDQKKHLQLNVDYDQFVEMLQVHKFPTLLRA